MVGAIYRNAYNTDLEFSGDFGCDILHLIGSIVIDDTNIKLRLGRYATAFIRLCPEDLQDDLRDPDKMNQHNDCACPWCGGSGHKWFNYTQTIQYTNCFEKGRVTMEKANQYKGRLRKNKDQGEKTVWISSAFNPKDDLNHPYWKRGKGI